MNNSFKKSSEIFDYAKTLFPGGTQFLSKQPHRSGCDDWPTYYTYAEGIKIIDYFGNEFLDFTQLGSGASILGYNKKEVNNAVKEAIDKGSMTSLNVPEEIDLAELLLSIHPWGNFVKYARTGADIVSIAIKIARAYKKKSRILFCGYHGWHDWYISSNLSDINNLNNHLFSGLEPYGVPAELSNTSIPFKYNDVDNFVSLFEKNVDDLAAVIMEPLRTNKPDREFLFKIREKTEQFDIPLIYDEITSGWRQTNGGVHLSESILSDHYTFPNPDIVVYSKAIANGFPFACLIANDKLFKSAEDCFISSTLWTEKIGTIAALETIKYFIKNKVKEVVKNGGQKFRSILFNNSKKHGYKFLCNDGIEALSFFKIEKNGENITNKFSQKMLEKGIMITSAFYSTFAHKDEDYDMLDNISDEVLEKVEV